MHPRSKKSNLTSTQRAALNQMKERQDIIIKPSDKVGNLVKQTTEDYMAMCYRILENPSWYRRISVTRMHDYQQEFFRIIDGAFSRNLISKNTRDFLKNHHPITPTFYALPKTHKSLHKPPGRPIISGIGSLTQQASPLIDDYLCPHVESLPTYLKDTIHVLTVLEGLSVPTNSILASSDVEALYSSIPYVLYFSRFNMFTVFFF